MAAPYRSLLGSLVGDLTAALPAPAPVYRAIRMADLFQRLAASDAELRTKRITVQANGDPGLSLVTLSGDSPLQSTLWGSIEAAVKPYRAWIEYGSGKDRVRVRTDRAGNFLWYQATESSLPEVVRALAYLCDNLSQSLNLSPLRRGAAAADPGGDDDDE
jgi:hypothetical protein